MQRNSSHEPENSGADKLMQTPTDKPRRSMMLDGV
jgi:hypothetical protein